MNDPDAARALAEANRLLRVGAVAAELRFPAWHVVFTLLLVTAIGGAFDIPRHAWDYWGGVIRLPVVFALTASWSMVTRTAWRRARPLPAALGRWWRAVIFAGVFVLYGAATVIAGVLHRAGVPLPHTLAGLVAGVVVVCVMRYGLPWINSRYRKNIERGRW